MYIFGVYTKKPFSRLTSVPILHLARLFASQFCYISKYCTQLVAPSPSAAAAAAAAGLRTPVAAAKSPSSGRASSKSETTASADDVDEDSDDATDGGRNSKRSSAAASSPAAGPASVSTTPQSTGDKVLCDSKAVNIVLISIRTSLSFALSHAVRTGSKICSLFA